MLARIPQTNPLVFLMTVSFFLTGCGGTDTSSQRQSNSNPFAPSARSNNTHSKNNSAPSRPQTPKVSQKNGQPKASPPASSPVTPKAMAQRKPKPVETVPADPTNIISEASKRTLDKENPGVAIIVRGISGEESKALPIIQNEIRASFSKPPAADLVKQKPLAESTQNDVEHFVFDEQLVLVVRPAPADLFGFAQNLKWGKVKEIDIPNRIITVDALLKDLTAQTNATSVPSGKGSAKSDSLKSNQTTNPAKPAMKQSEKKSGSSNPLANDRDLKPRPGEETLDWALRVIAGTSPFAHDTACKQLALMKPDPDQLQRVSEVLAMTLPLAKNGFRMKEHVNAMSVWYTDDATMQFAALLSNEKSGLVREEIIGLLPKIRSEVTAEVLVGRLSNRRDMKGARTALRIMGEIAEQPVINLLNHPDSSLRIEACKILQSIGTQEAIAALKKRAETEDSNVIKQLITETQTEINKKSATPEK